MTKTLKLVGEATDLQHEGAEREASVEMLAKAVSGWFVRKDGKYFDVDRLNVKLSKDDVKHACLIRIKEEFGPVCSDPAVLREVFQRTIEKKHHERDQMIPVWNGSIVCQPGHEDRYLWSNGTVAVNVWRKPAYRNLTDVEADPGLGGNFLDVVISREAEREKFLDWLSWCLQHENDKPTWAPLFYSKTKGSGKSTLCKLAARLFGFENSTTQNSVDKLTGRFNSPVLTSKLVVSEEVHLPSDSAKGNALKTYITETEATVERKGVDAERIRQYCCFLFTTNHLPMWIEAEDRRYYLIEIDHDGHATGETAIEFAALIGALQEYMEDDRNVAALYRSLMEREQSPGFSAKTLDVVKDATPLMKRVHTASEATRTARLRECLMEARVYAIPEAEVVKIIKENLGGNISSTKHLMAELGWSKDNVKWGGCQYERAIWTEKGFWAHRGKLHGPDDFEENLAEHLGKISDVQLL